MSCLKIDQLIEIKNYLCFLSTGSECSFLVTAHEYALRKKKVKNMALLGVSACC